MQNISKTRQMLALAIVWLFYIEVYRMTEDGPMSQ